MAKITEVVVSRAQKINLGNYQSADAFVSVKSEVADNENPDEVFAMLVQKAEEYLEIEVARIEISR